MLATGPDAPRQCLVAGDGGETCASTYRAPARLTRTATPHHTPLTRTATPHRTNPTRTATPHHTNPTRTGPTSITTPRPMTRGPDTGHDATPGPGCLIRTAASNPAATP